MATTQDLCELGQEQLMAMAYLEAEATLAVAEQQAWAEQDWDTLARVYMPLQEARRQRRQRCGEGVVCLDLLAENAADRLDPRHVVENYPHGQLLVAGWGSVQPAVEVRQLARELGLYVETFLGAVYPVAGGRAVAIAPLADMALPPARPGQELAALRASLPATCILLPQSDLPSGSRKGSAQTFGLVMDLWEQLHRPFLAAADALAEPVARIEACRRTIEVDCACELAHQNITSLAHSLARRA